MFTDSYNLIQFRLVCQPSKPKCPGFATKIAIKVMLCVTSRTLGIPKESCGSGRRRSDHHRRPGGRGLAAAREQGDKALLLGLLNTFCHWGLVSKGGIGVMTRARPMHRREHLMGRFA